MIEGKDTLPYKEKLIILKDTEYMGGKTYLPGDTTYEGACRTFEKINGKIVNQSDSTCAAFGIWVIPDSLGNYWTGTYYDGYQTGIWKKFNKSGRLLREHEEIHLDKKVYIVKDIDYTGVQPKIIINKPFLAFYIRCLPAVIAVFCLSFFTRVFINSKIYNIENETDYFPLTLPGQGQIAEKISHGLVCMFTLWFFSYRPENKQRVLVSHILSLIAVGMFVVMLIGPGIEGN